MNTGVKFYFYYIVYVFYPVDILNESGNAKRDERKDKK